MAHHRDPSKLSEDYYDQQIKIARGLLDHQLYLVRHTDEIQKIHKLEEQIVRAKKHIKDQEFRSGFDERFYKNRVNGSLAQILKLETQLGITELRQNYNRLISEKEANYPKPKEKPKHTEKKADAKSPLTSPTSSSQFAHSTDDRKKQREAERNERKKALTEAGKKIAGKK